MPPNKMIVNDVDLSLYSMWVEVPRGWGAGPQRQDRQTAVEAAGVVVSPLTPHVGGRTWNVSGVLIATSAIEARDKWDLAKAVLADVWLEVMILPWTDRLCVCRYQSIEWLPVRIEDYGWRFSLTFLSPSAYLVSPRVDSYGLAAGGEVALALGTAPSPYLARLIGPASTPVLTYQDAHGIVRGRLAVAGDLATAEWLEVNSQTLTMIRHSSGGLVSNGAGLLDNASQLFPLDPADAVGTKGPTLNLSSGAAVLYVRNAYL